MAIPARTRSSHRGFSLIELLIAVAMSLVIAALVTKAFAMFERDQGLRKIVTKMQGAARLAMGWVEQEVRQGSLAAGTGIIWTDVGGACASRPAVQIFSKVPGGGALDVKPGTDALLVIAATNTPRAATAASLSTSAGIIPVTDASAFTVGQAVMFGDYGDASWGVLDTVQSSGTNQTITLKDSAVNVLPGRQAQQLAAGAIVRGARARLYYVDTADELVRLTLSVPRAPSSLADVTAREVLGVGFENMHLDCQLEGAPGSFQACPAVLSTGDPVAAESSAAFGAFVAGQGPVFTSANVNLLRQVTISFAVRSQTAVEASQGDAKIALVPGVTLPVGTSGSDTAAYVRRAYQFSAALRNTSLGTF